MIKYHFPVLSGIILFAASGFATNEAEKTLKVSDLHRLVIENAAGNTDLSGAEMSEIKIESKHIKWDEECELTTAEENGLLTIKIKENKSWWDFFSSADCETNLQILTPQKLNLTVNSGSGNVQIKNVSGNHRVNIGSGNLNLVNGELASLVAKSGSGDLEISADLKDIDIMVGSGNIDLTYQKAPTDGTARLKSGSGNATLVMPKKSKIKVDFTAGSGNLNSQLAQDPNAAYSINMKAGSGNLTIKAKQ